MRDTNHNYDSVAKQDNRAVVFAMYRKLVTANARLAAKSPDAACVTLASCVHNGKSHPSYDIEQWRGYFGDRFIGVNYANIARAFKRHHPYCDFRQGDGYETFATLASFVRGLFYLDTTQTMERLTKDAAIRAQLSRFFENGRPSSMLALNLMYNRRIVGELPNGTRKSIKARIKAIVKGLPLYGWELHTEYHTYQSTERTQMVTIFFYKKTNSGLAKTRQM